MSDNNTPNARVLTPLAVGVVMLALILFAPPVLNDGDSYWHLATGQWILAHGRVPTHDPFSFTIPGAPWVAHEWLSELLMALGYSLAGWSGTLALFALAVGAAAWMLVRRLSLDLTGLTLVAATAMALACMSESLLARPQLFMLPLMTAWTVEMLAARDADRPPRLAFALLMTAWANLHGSYVLAFVVAGAFGLEALTAPGADRLKVIRGWGLFGLASIVCAMITPLGPAGIIHPFSLMGMKILPHIVEWRSEDFSQLSAFAIALLATLYVCLSRGVRVPPVRLLLLLAMFYMSLQHVRHQLVLAVLAPLILAAPVGQALGHAREAARPSRALLAGFAVACVLLLGLRLALPIQRVDGPTSPVTALAHVPADLAAQPVLNGYGLGGYLIAKGVRPYIDGRADMYGDAFTEAYFQAVEPDPAKLKALLETHRIAWTIFGPEEGGVKLLDADPKWRRIYADRYAIVHQRVTQAP
ncbi:hypothetical protein [Caulobacter sp. RHG1]|uniref:hypothetical protein n=1 Tax=Caulobacter sp. (strain RHG1) TaxID=2545762 RepID=UPI0015556C14|nr:hypothetical protein [Caulobacter sp. RHG1]NQE63194.1 hypothetical protein [Caulobacter sp. RHG1]